jgi:hypothetical protein
MSDRQSAVCEEASADENEKSAATLSRPCRMRMQGRLSGGSTSGLEIQIHQLQRQAEDELILGRHAVRGRQFSPVTLALDYDEIV